MSAPNVAPAQAQGEGAQAGTTPSELRALYAAHNAAIARARAEYETHPFLNPRSSLTPRAADSASRRAAELAQRTEEANRLWRRGWKSKQIARHLGVARRTVCDYLQDVA